MTIPRSILLPYNSSEAAQQAVPYALDLAAQTGATLHTLSVEVLRGGLPVPSGTPDGIVSDTRAHFARLNGQHARGRYAAEDVHFVHASRRDIEASSAILLYAAAQDIDLIVMGTRGRRGLRRLALGSVAEKVVRWAPCPVLTTRQAEKPKRAPGLRHILMPTDFSRGSREALRYAKALAALFGAQVELFHAVEETLHPAFYSPSIQSIYDVRPDVEAEAIRQLEELDRATERPDGEGSGRDVLFSAAPGPAPQAIAKRAEEADLIVMARHEHTMLEHLARGIALGGVTEKVMRVAPCPVLTAHHFPQTLIGKSGGGPATKGGQAAKDRPAKVGGAAARETPASASLA